MAVNKNQHFVPQFYLKRFSQQKPSVGAWILGIDKIVQTASISDQCSKSYFYDREVNLDAYLTGIESLVSRTIRSVSEFRFDTVTTFDWDIFFLFLVTQIHRTEAARMRGLDQYRGFQSLTIDRFPEGTKIGPEFPQKPLDHVDMVNYSHRIYPQLMDLHFCIVNNRTGVGFVTSDNPVVLINPASERKIVARSIGLSSAGIVLIFPLDPSNCLVLYDANVYQPIENAPQIVFAKARDVTLLNRVQVLAAHKAIYFDPLLDFGYLDLKSMIQERSEAGFDFVEFVMEGKMPGGERYRRVAKDELVDYKETRLIAFKQKVFKSDFWPSFLKLKRKPIFERTGTGAGDLRSREFLEICEMYEKGIKSKTVKPLHFLDFFKNLASQG